MGKKETEKKHDDYLKHTLKLTKHARGFSSAALKDSKVYAPSLAKLETLNNYRGKTAHQIQGTVIAKVLGIEDLGQIKNRRKLGQLRSGWKRAEQFSKLGKFGDIKVGNFKLTTLDLLTMGQQSLKLYHNLKNNNHADMATYSAEGVFRTADYVMNVVIDSGVASLTVALLNTYGAPVAIPIWAVAYIAKNYYLTPAWDRMEAVQKPIIAGLMRQTKNNWWFDPQTNTLKAQIQYSAELHGTFKNNFAFSIPLATQKINKNNLTSINFSNTHGYNNSPLSENNLPSPPRPPAAAAIPVAQVTALLTNQAHAASQQLDESTRLLFSLGENPIPPTSNGINPQPWHFAFNPIDTGESNQPNTLYVGYDRTRGLGDYSAEQGPTVKASLWRATAAGGIVFAPALSISIPLDITLKMLGIYTMPVLIGGLCLKKLVDFIHLKALPADEQSAQKIDLALTKYINAHQRNLSWHNYNPRRLLFNWDTVENSRTDELKAQIQNGIKANANNQTIIHHYRALDYAVNTKNYDLSKKWQINAKEAVDQFNHYLNQRTADYNQAMQSKNYSGAKNAAAEILTWLPEAPMSSVMYGLAIESQDVNRTQDYFNKAFKLCNTPEQQKIVGEHYVPYLWRKCETAPSSGNIEQLRGHLKPYINTDGKLRQVYLSTFIYDFQYKKNIEDPNQIIAHMKQMQRNMGYLTPHDRAPFARALYHLKAYSESFTAYGQEGGASGLDDAIKSICGLHIPHEAQASANALMQTCESLQKSINLTPHNHETLGEYAREIAILSGHALAQYYSQKDLAQYVFYLEYLSQDALLGKSAEIADILLSAYYCLAKNNCGDKVELLQKSQALYPHLSDPQKEHITTQLKIAWLEKQCNSAGVNEKYITLHATLKNQFATGQGVLLQEWFLWLDVVTALACDANNNGNHEHAIAILSEPLKALDKNLTLKENVVQLEGHLILNRQLANTHQCVARIYEYNEENYTAAQLHIEQAQIHNKNSVDLHLDLARILCKQNQVNEAEQYLTQTFADTKDEHDRERLQCGVEAIHDYNNAQVNCLLTEMSLFGLQQLARILHECDDIPHILRTTAGITATACQMGAGLTFSILREQNSLELKNSLGGLEKNISFIDALQESFKSPAFAIRFVANSVSIARNQLKPNNHIINTAADLADIVGHGFNAYDTYDYFSRLSFDEDMGGPFSLDHSYAQAGVYFGTFFANHFARVINTYPANRQMQFESPLAFAAQDAARTVGLAGSATMIAKRYGKEVVKKAVFTAVEKVAVLSVGAKVVLATGGAVLVVGGAVHLNKRWNRRAVEAMLCNGQLLIQEGHELIGCNKHNQGMKKIEEGYAKLENGLAKGLAIKKELAESVKQTRLQTQWFLYLQKRNTDVLITECTLYIQDPQSNATVRAQAIRFRAQGYLLNGQVNLAMEDYKLLSDNAAAHHGLALISRNRGALHITKIELLCALTILTKNLAESNALATSLEQSRLTILGFKSPQFIHSLFDWLYTKVKENPKYATWAGVSGQSFGDTDKLDQKQKEMIEIKRNIDDYKDQLEDLIKEVALIWQGFGGSVAGIAAASVIRILHEVIMISSIMPDLDALPGPRVDKVYFLPPKINTKVPVVTQYRSLAPLAGCNRGVVMAKTFNANKMIF